MSIGSDWLVEGVLWLANSGSLVYVVEAVRIFTIISVVLVVACTLSPPCINKKIVSMHLHGDIRILCNGSIHADSSFWLE